MAPHSAPDTLPSETDACQEAARLEASAMRLLAQREHSRAELERKLSARFGSTTCLAAVLDELQSRNCLSDRRFIENYIDQRCKKGFGPLRIKAELAERGLSSEDVGCGLDAAAIDWDRVLQVTAERKFGSTVVASRQDLALRGRFLEQRGFPVSLIRRYFDLIAAS